MVICRKAITGIDSRIWFSYKKIEIKLKTPLRSPGRGPPLIKMIATIVILGLSLSFTSPFTTAFAPHASILPTSTQKNPVSSATTTLRIPTVRYEKSLDEEVEEMVRKELGKKQRYSNLRSERGVEYAPWMRVTREDEANIRKIMLEKAEARRRRQQELQDTQGELTRDFGFQELSGTGLKFKIVDGNSVELEWVTGEERNTKGFLVKRRAAKTKDFFVISSFQDNARLESKGPQGGVYRFLDQEVSPGGWVYRITECDRQGAENDLSQCLVEIQTPEERRAGLIAAVGISILAVGAVVAGSLLDPLQY